MRDRGTCTNKLTVRGDAVETAILEGLKSRLMAPDLFQEFAREFMAEVNRQRSSDTADLHRARQELNKIDVQIARLVDAVANGADAQAFNDKIKELEAARPDLEVKLSRPVGQPLLHPNLAKVYREKVERLTEAFHEPRHGREIFELIRSLIREVRLVPASGGLTIELVGDLAGILALSEAGKGSTASGSKALQIKMVAGTRNHLYRTEFLLRSALRQASV